MKGSVSFVCSECGNSFSKWLGRCSECESWGTLEEVICEKLLSTTKPQGRVELVQICEPELEENKRLETGFVEIDRVLGGGLVEGELILFCGEPGMGKSTLLLQICDKVKTNKSIYYFSGEESVHQIQLRAKRLEVNKSNIFLAACTDLGSIEAKLASEALSVGLVVIDSIQTLQISQDKFDSSISQIKGSAVRLMHLAKHLSLPILIVGHVNKEGLVAGPKVLEHIVDAVIYLDGERSSNYRILRSVKNRFGPTSELAILDMQEEGFREIKDPAAILLEENFESVSGVCATCAMEGARALFLEIQALTIKSNFVAPKRTATGLDYNRVCVLIAVLEKRLGVKFSNLDVYVNTIGGFKFNEPDADLAIALALLSTLKDQALGRHIVAFGEIDLTGRIRSVSNIVARVKESQRLGFKLCVLPQVAIKVLDLKNCEIELWGAKTVSDLIRLL